MRHHGHGRQHGPRDSPGVRARGRVGRRLRRDGRARRVDRRDGARRGRRDGLQAAVPSRRSGRLPGARRAGAAARTAGSTCCSTSPRCRHFNRLEDITDEEWDRARRGEVDLVFYLTRAAWPHLKASRGVVVNMASLNASLSFKLLASLAHTTNKAGIIGMTRQLAMEGREHGIRANSISPGLIESNATRGQLEDPEWAERHARQDVAGPPRPARGSRERRRCSWPPTRAPT